MARAQSFWSMLLGFLVSLENWCLSVERKGRSEVSRRMGRKKVEGRKAGDDGNFGRASRRHWSCRSADWPPLKSFHRPYVATLAHDCKLLAQGEDERRRACESSVGVGKM